MKILLINPSQANVYGNLTPPTQMHMGLAYLSAYLRKSGFSVEIIDMDADRVSPADLVRMLGSGDISITGFSVTTPVLKSALDLAKIVKSTSAKTTVVFGGVHPSVMPKETLAYKQVDCVIRGEGEVTLAELAEGVRRERGFAGIKGLLYKDGGKIIDNGLRDLIENLDTIPFPARDLFKNKSYTYPDAIYAETAPMITSRGCPGRCTYCNASAFWNGRFRARSAANVADETEMLVKEMGVREIHIWDDNFVTRKERVPQIRNEIVRRRIKVKFSFPAGLRADFIDEDVIKALVGMGAYSIAIGVESGSQRILDRAKKGITPSRVRQAVAIAKRHGLEIWAFFMLGLPGEDEETAEETIRFAKELDPDIAKFHIFKPYPGSCAYAELVRDGRITDYDLSHYGIHTPPVHRLESLSGEDLVRIQKRAYREFYGRPSKILKQLLRLRSPYRARLNMKAAWDLAKMALRA